MHPEWQDILANEAKEEFKDGEVSFEKILSGFKTTKNFINEVLRLKSPAFLVGRKALEDLKIGDMTIYKGDFISVSFKLLHYDPKIWGDDVLEFNPNRFKDEDKEKTRFFHPFSIGARSCIGKRFAEIEIIIALAKITSNFKLSIDKKKYGYIGERVELTMKPSMNINLFIENK